MINPNHNPYITVQILEERIAEWAGCMYAVATDSCSSALFLSLQYRKAQLGDIGEVTIPNYTYPSVPCSIIHAGGKVKFSDVKWDGIYELCPLEVYDGALRFRKNMFAGGLHCVSMHIKKRLSVGRGGLILTNDIDARDWLRKARFDGRTPVPLRQDNFDMLGWNCYLTPEQAARALQIFELLRDKENPDLKVEEQEYADLSKFKIYQQ